VIYILLFGAERFKEKTKIAVFIILGAVVTFFVIGMIINAPKNIAEGNWKVILIDIIVVLGSFVAAYILYSQRKKE